ncbi:MAG: class II glutamine amidotransferase [Deltaproteobacteria bacterium]|nr:class II glutamine amidotransferase [Deltaproteobacteria bacterium]
MCRMIAFASAEPVDGTPYLARLADFSRRGNLVDGWERRPGGNHPDGWGIAYLQEGGIRVLRSGKPACADPLLGETRVRTDRFLGHVRYASNAATVNAANAHPFVAGGIALAHNGTFRGSVGREADARGVSDTLVFLERLAGRWREKTLHALREALSGMLGDPGLVGDYSAANMLIASGGKLFALRKFRMNEGYYTLFLRATPGRVEAASEPPDDDAGWEPMGNGLLAELYPRGSRSVSLSGE